MSVSFKCSSMFGRKGIKTVLLPHETIQCWMSILVHNPMKVLQHPKVNVLVACLLSLVPLDMMHTVKMIMIIISKEGNVLK